MVFNFQHFILPDGRFIIQNTTARLSLALHRNLSHNTENSTKQVYLPCTDNQSIGIIDYTTMADILIFFCLHSN